MGESAMTGTLGSGFPAVVGGAEAEELRSSATTERRAPRARVLVLTTGGTISSRRAGAGLVATDGAFDVLGEVQVPPDVEVEYVDLMRVGSYQMRLADLRALSDAVIEAFARTGRQAVDGIVITHGTDTLEESAILLDLVHDDRRPVVLTGAQRPADAADTDGPRNLSHAIAVAAAPEARGLGVAICFAGEILRAKGTRKVQTSDLSAFDTLGSGAIGHVDDRRVRIHVRPVRSQPLALPTERFDHVRVDVVAMYPGADDRLLRAAVDAGARGIVIAGSGIGNANPTIAATVAELTAAGVVVALSTRVSDGPVIPLYGNGGGADLVRAGAVVAEFLPAFQARILLALLLSSGQPPDSVRSRFTDHV